MKSIEYQIIFDQKNEIIKRIKISVKFAIVIFVEEVNAKNMNLK